MIASKHGLAVFGLVVLTINWGWGACVSKLLSGQVTPLYQIAAQTGIGMVCILAYGIRRYGRAFMVVPPRHTLAALNLRALVSGVLGIGMIIAAYRHAPLSTVVWIQLLPTGVLWSMLLWRERVSAASAAFLVLGVGGVACMYRPVAQEAFGLGTGELLALGGTVLFTLSYAMSGMIVRELGVARATFWNLLLMAVGSMLAAGAIDGLPTIPGPAESAALVMTGVAVALNSALLFYGPSVLPASVVSGVLSLEAIWAPLFAYALFGEVPTALAAFGGGIVVVSAVGATLVAPPVCQG